MVRASPKKIKFCFGRWRHHEFTFYYHIFLQGLRRVWFQYAPMGENTMEESSAKSILDVWNGWKTPIVGYIFSLGDVVFCMRTHVPFMLWCVVERANEMLNDRHPETRTASFMRSLSAKKILRMNWFLVKYPNKNSTIFPVAFQQQFFVKCNFFYQVYSWNHIGTMNILGQPEFGSHWLTVRIAQEAVDLCMQTLKEAKYDMGHDSRTKMTWTWKHK